mmetsp:Transcript_45825/g.115400  ORF Transcript_45825/g.115400 Transcript_45825/m.115400 type:complete len:416 (+) Transcript_45825:54-1301(+)
MDGGGAPSTSGGCQCAPGGQRVGRRCGVPGGRCAGGLGSRNPVVVARVSHKPLKKHEAPVHLGRVKPLVGLVGLFDGARPAHHAGDADLRKPACVRAESHAAHRHILAARQALREWHHGRILGCLEAGDAALLGVGQARRVFLLLHVAVHRVQLLLDGAEDGVCVVAGDVAELEHHLGGVRHDVQGRAALEHARVHCGKRRLKVGVVRAVGLKLRRLLPQEMDKVCAVLDRIDTLGCQARVAREAAQVHIVRPFPFVAVDHCPQCGLPDDAAQGEGGDCARLELIAQCADAHTANLLIVCEAEMDGKAHLVCSGGEAGHKSQAECKETLHVACAPSVPTSIVLFSEAKWVCVPLLVCHRYHIHVPRQHDAALVLGANGRVQVGLRLVAVVHQLGRHAVAGQELCDVLRARQVGVA